MQKPQTVSALEDLGRVRLSKSFFMRDFLYSEISQIDGIPNIPDFPDRAIEAVRQLCEQLLEPLQERFGRIAILSGVSLSGSECQGGGRRQQLCEERKQQRRSHLGLPGCRWPPRSHCLHRGAGPAALVWPDRRLDAIGLVDARQPALRQPVLVPQTGCLQSALEH